MVSRDQGKLSLSPDLLLWAKQPGETNDDYLRFQTFLELGPDRSLEQALEQWNTLTTDKKRVSLSLFKKLSMLNRWTERVGAWDTMKWNEDYKRRRKQLQDMRDRHRKHGIAMQVKGLQALNTIPVQAIGPNEARMLVTDGTKLEAVAIGNPDAEHAAVAGTPREAGAPDPADTSAWTPEQRRQRLMALHAENAARLQPSYDDDPDED